jgi:hypothetical protein
MSFLPGSPSLMGFNIALKCIAHEDVLNGIAT